MNEQTGSVKKYLKYAILAVAIFGLLFAFTNLEELKRRFVTMNLAFFYVAVAFSLMNYLAEGLFLRLSLMVFDEKLPLGAAFKYSLLINSLGYLVSLGGLTPFATQVYFLGFHGIKAKKATLSRIVQLIFFNISFNLFFIFGFLFLITGNEIHGFNRAIIIVAFCAFLAAIFFFYTTIFSKPFQLIVVRALFCGLNRILRVFSKRVQLEDHKAIRYFDDFANGFRGLLKVPSRLISMAAITLFDMLVWIGVLYFSFLALRYAIHPGVLFIGFAVGQIVSVASMIPGGMGTMEGSMALVYSLFGVPFETALGAALLYRFVFNIIPFLISAPLYLSLRKR